MSSFAATQPDVHAPSHRLSRIARLAGRMVDGGTGLISLLRDEPTTPAGSIGCDGASVGSVGGVLCLHACREAATVVIGDARSDDRLAGLAAVRSGHVGACLAVPLLDRAGETVGALSVLVVSERSWSAGEIALLEDLGSLATTELELTALQEDHQSDRVVWQLAIEAGGIGTFDWDLTTGELRWDEVLLSMFGLDRETFDGTIEAFNASVHADDVGRVTAALEVAIETCGAYEAEYRVVLPHDHGIRWVTARGRAIEGAAGTAARVLGAAFDSTAVRDGDARVSRVLEAMPSAFYHLGPDWRFTYVNATACALLGATREELIGGVVWDLYPAALGTDFESNFRAAVASGQPVAFQAYYPPPLDGWYEIRAWPTPDGLSVYFLDITTSRTAQGIIDAAARRKEIVASVSGALTGTLDLDEAATRLADAVVPALGQWCLVSLVDVEGTLDWRRRVRDVGGAHADPDLQRLVQEYRGLRVGALTDDAYLIAALVHGRLVEIDRDATAAITSVLTPGRAQALLSELAPACALALPLRARGRTVGLLSVFRGGDDPAFSQADRDTLQEVASRAGLALDNARLYAQQREMAESLQRALMTAPPEPQHLQIAVRYQPAAQTAQVGGDWYDAFLQDDDAVVLVIGDVVGHDTAAAAAMGQVRGLLRGIAVHSGEAPAAVLRGVDQVMRSLSIAATATAVIARVEQTPPERLAGRARLRWSNAGHPPPLTVTPEGRVSVLSSTPELLLGVDASAARHDHLVDLEPGATVLLYTDGLVERRGQSFDDGLRRLEETVGELARTGCDLDTLCDRLLQQLLPEHPEDDVAISAIRLHAPG